MRTNAILRAGCWITGTFLWLQLDVFHVPAATLTWTNTLGGEWNTAANWSPNTVPGAGDTANITTAGTYTVNLSVDASVAALNLGAASGKQTLGLAVAKSLNATSVVIGPNGIFNMSAGTLTGKVTVQSGGVLNFLTSANKNVYSLVIDNQGTVNHVAGSLIGGSTPATIITN
ncbi:hypothetical protein GC207_12340, partial [bacterium]|nr:hypothetical protein [bacterium]